MNPFKSKANAETGVQTDRFIDVPLGKIRRKPVSQYGRKRLSLPEQFIEVQTSSDNPSPSPKSDYTLFSRDTTSFDSIRSGSGLKGENEGLGAGDVSPVVAAPQRRRPLSVVKAWLPELIWCFSAILIFISLVILLVVHDERRLPQWPLNLTINTPVAFLATVCRSILVVPIAEGISQLKWNWFVTGRRPIKDLRVFDQASRGPWGSMRLLGTARGRHMPLSSLACIVLIAGLITSFITQSAVTYQDRLVENDRSVQSCYGKKVKAFPPVPDKIDYEPNQSLLNGLERSGFQAVFTHVDQEWGDAEPSCPSANCNWPIFSSLGVCASISNVTDHLDVTEVDDYTLKATLFEDKVFMVEPVDWPWENSVNVTYMMPITVDEVVGISNMTKEELQNLDSNVMNIFPDHRRTLADWVPASVPNATLTHFYFIYSNNRVDPSQKTYRYRATELMLHFCVYDYNITVRDGVSRTEVQNTNTEMTDIWRLRFDSSLPNTYSLVNTAGDEAFNVSDGTAYWDVGNDFGRAFSGFYSPHYSPTNLKDETYDDFVAQIGWNLFHGINEETPIEMADVKLWDNLSNLTRNIAQAVTTYMRNISPDKHVKLVQGSTLSKETFIVIRWEWLAFLVVQIFLTILFLIAVMIYTASLDVTIVKTSNIAELLAIPRLENGGADTASEGSLLIGIRNEIDEGYNGRLFREGGAWSLDFQRQAGKQGKGNRRSQAPGLASNSTMEIVAICRRLFLSRRGNLGSQRLANSQWRNVIISTIPETKGDAVDTLQFNSPGLRHKSRLIDAALTSLNESPAQRFCEALYNCIILAKLFIWPHYGRQALPDGFLEYVGSRLLADLHSMASQSHPTTPPGIQSIVLDMI